MMADNMPKRKRANIKKQSLSVEYYLNPRELNVSFKRKSRE